MLKISLLYLFSSEYTRGLFQPFIGTITLENLNPYQFYLENNLNLNSFPYHGLMLFILYPFYFFSDLFSLELIFKTPLLLADLGILYVLLKLFPHKKNKIYMFYFINPIVIYSIYIHAQLDIVPTALLFGSIYFLTLNKYIWSSLFFAFSLATKIHILVAFPLIIFYIYKKIKNKKVNMQKIYIQKLKNIDIKEAKYAAYTITKYLDLLTKNNTNITVIKELNEELAQYKYKKNTHEFSESTITMYNKFKSML